MNEPARFFYLKKSLIKMSASDHFRYLAKLLRYAEKKIMDLQTECSLYSGHLPPKYHEDLLKYILILQYLSGEPVEEGEDSKKLYLTNLKNHLGDKFTLEDFILDLISDIATYKEKCSKYTREFGKVVSSLHTKIYEPGSRLFLKASKRFETKDYP